MFRRLLGEVRPYWWHIVLLFIVSISAVPLALVSPLPIKMVVDNVLGSQPIPGYVRILAPNPSQVSKDYVTVLAVAILLGSTVLAYLQNLLSVWSTNKVGNRMTLDMRARLFRQMQRVSILYHDTKGAADSTYRVMNDAPWLRWLTIDTWLPIITSALTLTAMIVVTMSLDWELALIALAVTPFLLLITVVFRKRLRMGWRRVKTTESAAMSKTQESLSAARVVKAFGQEERQSEEFYSRFSENATATLKVFVQGGVYNLLVGVVTAIGLAATLLVGIGHVESGVLTLGGLLMVNYYLTQLYSPLRNLGQKMLDMQMSLAGMERFLTILDEKSDVPESPNARPLVRAEGKIAFENVSFGYKPPHTVLRNVSFLLPPGTRLGVVGPTGAGKTTLSSLILRFFDPTEGTITLDDVDLKSYKIAHLRNQFAVVLQDTLLFSTTISENIRFARPEATMNEVVAAAKAANAHDFISSLPEGYDTLVGERGMRLSGGERQRISLARAFLKDAPVLILDEPTSSLDINTETGVLDAIQRLMSGRTTLMIGHRASALRNCNMILVLENGRMSRMTGEVASVLQSMMPAGMKD